MPKPSREFSEVLKELHQILNQGIYTSLTLIQIHLIQEYMNHFEQMELHVKKGTRLGACEEAKNTPFIMNKLSNLFLNSSNELMRLLVLCKERIYADVSYDNKNAALEKLESLELLVLKVIGRIQNNKLTDNNFSSSVQKEKNPYRLFTELNRKEDTEFNPKELSDFPEVPEMPSMDWY